MMGPSSEKVTHASVKNDIHNSVKLLLVLLTVAVLTIDISEGSSESRRSVSLSREKRTVRGQTTQDQTVSNGWESVTQFDWMHYYTPTTPSPENVNCYVEVPETRRVGGMCINLGRYSGCQAGMYLSFSSDACQRNPTGRRTRNRSRSAARSRLRRRQARLRRRFGPLLRRTNH